MRFVINPFTELLDVASLTGSGAPPVETITGNDGIPVGPDPTTFNINIVGNNTQGINITGNAGTFTLTVAGIDASTSQKGVTEYASNAQAAAQTATNVALTPSNITSFFSTNPVPTSQGGTGLSSPAAHQLMVTAGSSPFNLLGVASNGQIPIGSIGADPVLANLTAGTGISITNGPGTITIATSGTGTINTLTGNTGGAISPTAGNINTVGTGSITIAGSGSTLTTQLTGLTNHSLLVGAGTATITNLGVATNGQIPIGSTGADPVLATLTAGTGISITNGAGTITISVSGSAVLETLTGNSGGAISPTAGNINTVGTGSITIAGSGSTLTTQLTGLTNHNVLVGAGTATITNVAPSATSGVPLISQGAAADPVFGTAVVAGGGTGATSFTAYSVICGGTTSTGALQNVSGVGSSGQVLTSNGAAALPTWQALPSGGLVLLSTNTLSSTASVVYNNTLITSTYGVYLITFNFLLAGTNGTSLELQFSTDNGSTYLSSGYQAGLLQWAFNSTTASNTNKSTYIPLTSDSNFSSTAGLNGYIYLYGLAISSNPQVTGQFSLNTNTMGLYGVGYASTVTVNAIKIFASSGNLASGTIKLYGLS